MPEQYLPVLDFGNGIRVKNIEAPIKRLSFRAFRRDFAPFIRKRESIYSRTPGGTTWHSFKPTGEKVLEYYLTMRALALNPKSTYLDIASCLSLFPNYVAERIGGTIHRQDLFYPEGIRTIEFPHVTRSIHRRVPVRISCIGCDACDLPLESSTVDHITLHCSFEHFEGDADGRFAAEALRVLRPGGRMLIIPFYCGNEYQEIVKEYFATGCQFQRYYDPATFVDRVLSKIELPYSLEMRYYRNSRSIDNSFYCDYSLAIVRE